jgi:hypothetical protein
MSSVRPVGVRARVVDGEVWLTLGAGATAFVVEGSVTEEIRRVPANGSQSS